MKLLNQCYRMLVAGMILIGGLAGCQQEAEPTTDRLLARVGSRTLHLSELEGMFVAGITPQDSLNIIETIVNRWARDAALLEEAEAHMPPDLNIDRLVRDYRASLLRSNYEKLVVENQLDTFIAEAELMRYYERNKEQFQLETPIVRCLFIKVPLPTPQYAQLRNLWENYRTQLPALRQYATQYAVSAMLNDQEWHSVEELSAELPDGTISSSNLPSRRELTMQDGNFQYYLRIFEAKNRQDIAPLGYIKDRASRAILHRRKLDLVDSVRNFIFERELNRKTIELLYDSPPARSE